MQRPLMRFAHPRCIFLSSMAARVWADPRCREHEVKAIAHAARHGLEQPARIRLVGAPTAVSRFARLNLELIDRGEAEGVAPPRTECPPCLAMGSLPMLVVLPTPLTPPAATLVSPALRSSSEALGG